MKEIKKVKLSKALLTSAELKQLRGGGDVLNKNAIENCICEYNNANNVLTNENAIDSCKCSCIDPNNTY